MTSFDAMLDTWRDAGVALIVVALVVARADKLRERRAARRLDQAIESVVPESECPEEQGLERLRAVVRIPAQRGGE